jgi:hypothetical protein
MGTKGENIEEAIKIIGKYVENLDKYFKNSEEEFKVIHKKLDKSIRNIETVRFNPFGESNGGNQSFATAFLNDEGDGVILSSIYARERMSIFAKPIKNNSSSYELTDEEKEVLEKAGKNSD